MSKNSNKPTTSIEVNPQLQEQKNDIEKNIQFAENWSITLPEVTLWNLQEALRFIRNQEKSIISKMRESNEYVINEVKEMLELLFNNWSGRKLPEWYGKVGGWYKTSKWHYYVNYEDYKRWYFIEEPIEFLENYEWSLSNFMNRLEENLKNEWIMTRYKPKYINWKTQNKLNELRWKSVNELKWMDLSGISFVEIFKEEIKNLSKMPESDGFYWLKFEYIHYILGICEELWYKPW